MSTPPFRFAFLVLLSLLLAFPALARALDLQQLIHDVEQQYMGVSSHSRMEMQVATAHWQRNLTMEAWSLGREHFLVRILEPARERGVATLKVRREVWNYLPKVDRVIKIPPSMMGGAWMGSHITNDDLVKANHVDQDYTFTLLEETPELWRIEGTPRPDAAVVWGRIVYTVRKAPRVPVQVTYFDEALQPVRTITFSDVEKVGNRTLPLTMTVQPLDKPEEQTVLHYDSIEFDLPLGEDYFSLRNLKAR
ncbi:hypothetical protein JCM30471_13240 [Desulfuromonas carbonis]|uniref:outer membrane lipoprotein-sorting protein n=1 Tax=Desulfuromonas sp. DDH964 TaxID=1823759 RepID=UPI00078DFE4E|nr:outer membrane lipoprotein-sorting protein [Desulfuromonas sp. DDH964]AMV72808.1 hypothetical protein DBW_2478 [Desulfuromonas sp. DDH964]